MQKMKNFSYWKNEVVFQCLQKKISNEHNVHNVCYACTYRPRVHTENWSTFLTMLKKNLLSLHVRLLTVTCASPDAALSYHLEQMLTFQMLRGHLKMLL